MQEIFRLIFNTGIVAKIVLVILFILSSLSWGIALWKIVMFSRASKASNLFKLSFKNRAGWNDLYKSCKMNPAAPQALPFVLGLQEVMYQKKRGVTDLNEMRQSIVLSVEHAIGETVARLERALVLLSTIVSISPFLGLFGTVWGVMEAFISIGRQGSADISTVGPGIAEALITTVVGLFVAIPALAAYNLCVAAVRRWEDRLNGFVREFMHQLERDPGS